jgi:hypothetical protein
MVKLLQGGMKCYDHSLIIILIISIRLSNRKNEWNIKKKHFQSIPFNFFASPHGLITIASVLSKKEGRNTLLVPIFRGCFQFGPYHLISVNWVILFLNRFQFYR